MPEHKDNKKPQDATDREQPNDSPKPKTEDQSNFFTNIPRDLLDTIFSLSHFQATTSMACVCVVLANLIRAHLTTEL